MKYFKNPKHHTPLEMTITTVSNIEKLNLLTVLAEIDFNCKEMECFESFLRIMSEREIYCTLNIFVNIDDIILIQMIDACFLAHEETPLNDTEGANKRILPDMAKLVPGSIDGSHGFIGLRIRNTQEKLKLELVTVHPETLIN